MLDGKFYSYWPYKIKVLLLVLTVITIFTIYVCSYVASYMFTKILLVLVMV